MAIAKHPYILTGDGKAVVDDGKQCGAVLVGAGGTISDDLAKEYGIETTDPEPLPEGVNPGVSTGPNAAQVENAKQTAALIAPPASAPAPTPPGPPAKTPTV